MSEKVKIVIDCRMINMSGIGTYLKNIIPELVNSQLFDIICMGYKEIKDFVWYTSITYIPLKSKILSISEQFELPIKIPNCDILWSPNWNVPLFFTKAKKRIVTIHDVYHLAHARDFSKIMIYVIKIYMYYIRHNYKSIITVSKFSKFELHKYTSIPLKNINVIYLGVDDNFTKFKQNFKLDFSYILYVGNVKPHKNLLLSLKAFEMIDNKEIKFIIVGQKDGFTTNDDSLFDIIKTLDSRIIFTGKVSDDDLKNYYKNAKVFLFPSKYEGFGLPILEAMKFNLPIICSSSASIPEVAGNEVIYFDAFNRNSLVENLNAFLVGNKKCKHEKYENQLSKFNWSETAKSHIELFYKLLSRK